MGSGLGRSLRFAGQPRAAVPTKSKSPLAVQTEDGSTGFLDSLSHSLRFARNDNLFNRGRIGLAQEIFGDSFIGRWHAGLTAGYCKIELHQGLHFYETTFRIRSSGGVLCCLGCSAERTAFTEWRRTGESGCQSEPPAAKGTEEIREGAEEGREEDAEDREEKQLYVPFPSISYSEHFRILHFLSSAASGEDVPPLNYLARRSRTGTRMRCWTRVAVVPRKRSPRKRWPWVLIATKSHPLFSTQLMIWSAGSP